MDIKIKPFLKKNIPGTLRDILSSIYYIRSRPYSIKNSFFSQENISDFFVWNPYVEKIDFIAENIRALLTGENIDVLHCFKYFSANGELLSEEQHKSNDFFIFVLNLVRANMLCYTSMLTRNHIGVTE